MNELFEPELLQESLDFAKRKLKRDIREGQAILRDRFNKEAAEHKEKTPIDDALAMLKEMEAHYQKQAEFMQRIHVSSEGVDDPFMSAIVDYLGTLGDDQRRIESCYNIIKVCKHIANDLQTVKKETIPA
jgi:hypothetical protein